MSKIKPALTPEEWANPDRAEEVSEAYVLGNRHKLAALALHNRPYGFTREDVEMLRIAAHNAEHAAGLTDEDGRYDRSKRYRAQAAHLDSIADRIAALLPEEGS